VTTARRGGRRRSRRWFLGALGASAGAAGLTAIGACGDSASGGPPAALSSPTPTVAPTQPGEPEPTPTRPPPSGRHGGTLRYTALVSSDGRFDPHLTRSTTVLSQQALIYSRLIAYESQVEGRLEPDLALGLPEQPDELTYTFHLNPEARWHEQAPLFNRVVTANDVALSIERQRQGDTSFPRKARWSQIESVEALDERTLTVRTAVPFAGTLDRFASPEGFVVPPELEGGFGSNRQIGSGPFRWLEWSEGAFASTVRNPAWHGPEGGPFLDGVSAVQPRTADEVEADFRAKKLDAAVVGFGPARELKSRLPELREARSALAQFYGMRFLSALPPYDDERLRNAITTALDRRAMLDRFFDGAGTINPWVSAAMTRWSLPQAELQQRPGYRPGSGGREADVAEARLALESYLESKELPDPLELLVEDDVEESLGMGSLIRDQLEATLGLNVTITPVPIQALGQRLSEGQAPWAVGSDDGWIELDDWLFPHFHSEGTRNSFALRDDDLDALIADQRAEMSPDRRQAIGYDVQRRLLDLNVGANFVSEDVVTLFWPYVQAFPVDAGDAYQDRFARTWIDRAHPSYV